MSTAKFKVGDYVEFMAAPVMYAVVEEVKERATVAWSYKVRYSPLHSTEWILEDELIPFTPPKVSFN